MFFEFRPDWHRQVAVRGAVWSYYARIRSLLRERPELRRYLKRCRHCRIFFFTDPRNAGRDDLRCGFGCREAHRRLCSALRSAAYYGSHPEKKRLQNRKRYLCSARTGVPALTPLRFDIPSPIIRHVCVIVSLIERRRVGLDEVVTMLAKKARQPRMVKRRGGGYGRRRIDGKGS